MADAKISALVEETSPAATDVLPVVSGGSTKKVKVSNLLAAGPAYTRLSSTVIDANDSTAQNLYEVPVGKRCIIKHIVMRDATATLSAPTSFAFGYTAAAYTDVVADTPHTELTGADLFTIFEPREGATIGAAGQFLKVKPTAKGSAASVTVDVFGYTY